MKVKEIMERAGVVETGRAIAYIKDGLEEMNLISSENIVKGTIASTTSTGISVDAANTNVTTNTTDWTGLSGSTPPTGWTYYSESNNAGNATFTNTSDKLKIAHGASGESNMVGCYQALTVIPGIEYTLSLAYELSDGDIEIRLNSTEFAHSDGAPANILSKSISTGLATGTITETFTPTTTTIYIALGVDGAAGEYVVYDTLVIKPTYDLIKDSNNGFSNFSSGMKILINNSSSNDTDESTNATNGYFTCNGASTNGNAISVSDTLTTESAGETITVRGQTLNYMDLIKDKRYYSLPSEAIKITDIRVKNHLNTDDQWRSIPRMIGKPLNTDKDEI